MSSSLRDQAPAEAVSHPVSIGDGDSSSDNADNLDWDIWRQLAAIGAMEEASLSSSTCIGLLQDEELLGDAHCESRGSSANAQSEREWAPGEAESVLRAQLARLGLPQDDIENVVASSLGGSIDGVEDVW